MSTNGVPELVIGVDFGMSQTGVAYCQAPWTNPTTFQNWSNITSEIFNKTPSRLAYNPGTGQVHSFGYAVDLSDTSRDVKEYFKLHLHPEYQDDFQGMTHEQAMRYYRDYLTCIHDRIARFFRSRFPQWATMHVEWNFSVPTTWKHPGIIHKLTSVMRQAGFGRDGHNHSCFVTLTEAEAAAVYAAGQRLQRDDVLLVCDAGGGTTDVNIMKVKSEPNEVLRLDQLLWVEGRAIGSALIDIAVQQHLAERLALVPDLVPDPISTAERMMMGKFERFKCGFGSPGMTAPRFMLAVPGLQAGVDLPDPGIRDSQMEVSQETVRGLFDQQADSMIALIDEQLRSLQRTRPGEQVSYLVLSGGLASSEYIQSRLHSRYSGQGGTLSPNARGMNIILAEVMQLAVVQGLVRARAQQIGQHINPIVSRCAPVSYGVVVSQRYNPKIHLGQRTVRDPRDKKRYAIDQIEWLIHKGDRISDEGVSKRFGAKIRPAQLRRPWKAHFVLCTESTERLPQSMAERDLLRTLLIVSADIGRVERKVKNRHWWNFGERYELAQLVVKLIPGHADLKLRLISGGRLLNSEDDRVEVNWGLTARPQSRLSTDELDQLFS